MDKQTEYVLRTIEETGHPFHPPVVHRRPGILKSVSIAPAELEAFAEGIVRRFGHRVSSSADRVRHAGQARPPKPLQILPWRGDDMPVGRMFWRHPAAGRITLLCRPRWVLSGQPKLRSRGSRSTPIRDRSSSLFNDRRGSGPVPVDNVGYLITVRTSGQDFRRQAILTLDITGISVEFSHHEGGPGQQRIDRGVTPTR